MRVNKAITVKTFNTQKALKLALKAFNVGSMLSVGSDAKTVKGEKMGFTTGILYLIPDLELCPNSKRAGCYEGCLVSSGRGSFNNVKQARTNRTNLYKNDKGLFFGAIIDEIERLHLKHGNKLVIRLNGTSDISFENMPINYKGTIYDNIFKLFPNVQYYDYTKKYNRLNNPILKGINNYHLTLSYSGSNPSYANSVLDYANKYGNNIAVVFRDKSLPGSFKGIRVKNGDDTDLRFLDNEKDDSNVYIIGLFAKGKAKKDASGFVQDSKGLIGSF